MIFLVVGSGGREHAISWRLATSPGDHTVHALPGSHAIAADPDIPGACHDVDPADHEAVVGLAARLGVDVVVVGPEAPLCAGLTDALRARGVVVLGPDAACARLESSKAFAKEVMDAAGVPTAAWSRHDDLDGALARARSLEHPVVLKADGLAGGKGVVISHDLETSEATLRAFMSGARFGAAGETVVIEEFLEGVELSFMVLTDGRHVVPLATSQDHKRLRDGDLGPNTGGMGAITPSPRATGALAQDVMARVIAPTLAELTRRGMRYTGFLYAGLMLTERGPFVLEYNVRLGDPETQALMLATGADVADVFARAARGELTARDDLSEGEHACCVVLAAKEYPGAVERGHVIAGVDAADAREGVKVFHAGTRAENGAWVSWGGRVLGVTATGADPAQARERAYAAAEEITWEGMQRRADIGAAR
jgi:phosphoribosylamine--glycine ligase